jgi:DNA-binding transcriptional ArsR family regulator
MRAKTRRVYYFIRRDAQLRSLTSARRQDILDRLTASGPASVREIARMIGAQPSALYHHVKQLLALGLVVPAGHRVVRRKREALYATPAPRMRWIKALAEPRHRELFVEIAAAMCRQLNRDFGDGSRSDRARASGPARNWSVARLVGAPTPRTLARINRHLAAIAELLWSSPADGANIISFGWVMAPVGKSRPRKPPGRGRRARRPGAARR